MTNLKLNWTFARNMLLVVWMSNFVEHVCSSNSPRMDKLLEGYDSTVRPDFGVKPVDIWADLYVESFGNIEEANMEFKVFGYFRQQWTDRRLAGKSNQTITLKGSAVEYVWTPDPFCANARETTMTVPDSETNSKLAIFPDGKILYSKRVMYLASCHMELGNFPMDSQECKLKFGSYAYTMEDIIYKWVSEDIDVEQTEMAQFDYIGGKLSTDIDVFSLTGNFSAIIATFTFKRRIGYYMIQVYTPDMFVVMLSWIVFWMDKEDMGNRMALGITTILTIMFLLGSINASMPKVSYAKALDWYLLISFIFVFLTLVECMAVYIVTPKKASDKKKNAEKKQASIPNKMVSDEKGRRNGTIHKTTTPTPLDHRFQPNNMPSRSSLSSEEWDYFVICNNEKESHSEKWEEVANKIDVISRVIFPLLFVVFNVCYWIAYSL